MKQLLSSSVRRASLCCLLCLASANSYAFEYELIGDDFNDNSMDPNLWSTQILGAGVLVQEINGRLEVVLPADCQEGSSAFGGGYISRAFDSGGFDVQVDYQLLNWPTANGVRMGLVVGDWQTVSRVSVVYRGEGSDAYVMNLWSEEEGLAALDTADLNGTLRVVRTGNTVSGFLWDQGSGQWATIGSDDYPDGDKYFALMAWSDDELFAHQEVAVAFDNFRLSDPPSVPEGGNTLALLFSSLAGMVGLQRWSASRVRYP